MPAEKPSTSDEPANRGVIALSKSQIYRDYQRAFTRATGLPLEFHAPAGHDFPRGVGRQSPFCALMAKAKKSCDACLALQRQLEEEGQLETRTLQCFAGLCETASPVRIGDNFVAFLHTGHVFLHTPTRREFNRVAKLLIRWGSEVDLKQLEEAYFQTRVLSPEHYQAFVQLMAIFAQHLALCSSQLLLQAKAEEPAAISAARSIIAAHHAEELYLDRVARAVNLSATYFSALFKQATGLTFTDYIARVRIEKAKNLLQNPKLQVSAIAFEVGFQSLSQFNRAFKRVAGGSPKAFRAALANSARQNDLGLKESASGGPATS